SQDLAGALIAISVSKGPDVERLGFAEGELDRVLRVLSSAIVNRGGRVAYGGVPHNMSVGGEPNYTAGIQQFVGEAYREVDRQDSPFRHFLAPQYWRDWSAQQIYDYAASMASFSDLALVDLAGQLQILSALTENDPAHEAEVTVVGDDK